MSITSKTTIGGNFTPDELKAIIIDYVKVANGLTLRPEHIKFSIGGGVLKDDDRDYTSVPEVEPIVFYGAIINC